MRKLSCQKRLALNRGGCDQGERIHERSLIRGVLVVFKDGGAIYEGGAIGLRRGILNDLVWKDKRRVPWWKRVKIENLNVRARTWCAMEKSLMDPRLILAAARTMGTLSLNFLWSLPALSIVMVLHSLNDPIKCVTITLVKVIQVPHASYLTKRKSKSLSESIQQISLVILLTFSHIVIFLLVK